MFESNKFFWTSLVVLFIFQGGCKSDSQNISINNMHNSDQYIYQALRTDEPIQLTGDGQDSAWNNAIELTDFKLYWDPEEPPATSFKALHDDRFLYLLYSAIDPLIQSKLAALDTIPAVHSDRVEIFFKGVNDTLPYYSLEMDCLGRLFDSEGKFGQYIDADWNWPANELEIKTRIFDNWYTLEARISKSSLNSLGLINNNRIHAGIYRADYISNDVGERTPHWISWVKPDSSTPKFHIPSSFGLIVLNP